MLQAAPRRKREIYLDALRIFASLCVIYNHTYTYGFLYFTHLQESRWFPVYLLASVLCKVAVPLYFMISGALMLKKEESLSVILGKRIPRIGITLVLCSFVTYLLKNGWEEFSLSLFLKALYTGTISTPYWYLYAYLGYLLMLPFLRKLAKGMTARDFLYMAALQIGMSLLRVSDLFSSDYQLHLNSNLSLFVTTNAVFYPLMGHFLANVLKPEDLTGKLALGIGGIGLAGAALTGWITCVWCSRTGDWGPDNCQKFFSTLVSLPTLAAFFLARYGFARIRLGAWAEKAIVYIGGHTFGIYLFEWLYRRETEVLCIVLRRHMAPFLACLVWVVSAFFLGFCVTWVLKKLPGLDKLL